MKCLPRSLSRHARSINHIQNQITLKTFESKDRQTGFERTPETNISVHNANARENREILKDLIDVNCFLAKQQLRFRSNDESSTSSNRGNYVELLHTIAERRKMKD